MSTPADDLVTGLYGQCPKGYFCPQGTGAPQPCPAGTFSANEKATDVSFCELCTAGSYCSVLALTAVEGTCDAGFYCPAGSTS